HTIPWRGGTLRPYVDLDVIHAETPAFQEIGLGGIPLSFEASPNTSLAITPMLEFGGQSKLDPTTVLRYFLGVGLSYRPGVNGAMNSRFSQASPAEGSFQLYSQVPEVVGRFNLGLQLFSAQGLDLRLEYDLSVGGNYLSQVPTAKLTYRF
ncbi:MAG: autotransporter outer membrane beta-barrel domain-containing protein, partial [Synechococcaceae cyanobacterium]|nr:autotransporter outer membrane beta-barrel domain-containing protein [Synechococcaceae cyanobacterium]